MFWVSISTSANIGFAPIFIIEETDAKKDLGVTITSSPGFKLRDNKLNSRAKVPFATATAKGISKYFANSFSNFLPYLPKDNLLYQFLIL